MRLTCPNCSAQYEVPDEVIPDEGRDVQCSNCEETWFQAKSPSTPPDPQPVPDTAPAEPQPEPAPRQTESPSGAIDPSIASILKEEADREAGLRAQEGNSLETQTDLALEVPPEPDPGQAIKHLTTSETAQGSGQMDDLPDVDAINSSLRSDLTESEPDAISAKPRRSGGFLSGFGLIIMIGLLLIGIYGFSPQISDAVPQAAPVLDGYVTAIDQARLWLEAQTGAAQ